MTKRQPRLETQEWRRDVGSSWVVYLLVQLILFHFISLKKLHTYFRRERKPLPRGRRGDSSPSRRQQKDHFNWIHLSAPLHPWGFELFPATSHQLCVPPKNFQRGGKGGRRPHGAGRTKGQEAWEAINPSLWTWSLDADSMTAEQGPPEWNYLRLDRF